jgi:hypothetical protein
MARVKSVGRVPQTEGARLLKACDVFVSPHNSHMVDSRFFGSPTKLFEYMAMGGGVVGSDLEQLGEVLSPALRPNDLQRPVTNERAVLCVPGDVDEFVKAVVFLAASPQVCEAPGATARGCDRHYSWRRHVERIWQRAAGEVSAPLDVPARSRRCRSALPRATPTWNKSRISGTAIRSARSTRRCTGRTRSSGTRKSKRIDTASTDRGCWT